jgi:heavy metal sensor kinase
MIERLAPKGLRTRLAVAISLIVVAVVAATFFALHQGTGADLRSQIDNDLETQYEEFRAEALPRADSADELTRAARRFLASQRYHPESRIFAIEVADGPVVTNQREVVERELEDDDDEGEDGQGEEEEHRDDEGLPGLLAAPEGLSTVTGEETGRLRVLSRPISAEGRRLGTFRVADPLNAVTEAQEGLRDTFLIVGAVALVAAIAIGVWVATLVTRPLRRMSGFAADVDAGDLGHRLGDVGGAVEVTTLAESFNRMLDRLEGAFRRQREFVADASHELRTPLTVLRGETELLARETEGQGDGSERARKLLREIDRMDRLVADMLTLAGAESGTLIERRMVPLEDLFEDLSRDLPLLGPRKYRVGQPPAGTLDADPDRLAQVLRNLVRNAVAHTTPEGSVKIDARQVNGSVEFAVHDDGTGIEPEQLDRIFDRFYRTDGGRARESGGSGLGLAIARAIVEAHGGRIWAESRPGSGTTIRFDVPGYRGAS